ncbi:MAG: type II secretion system F family protein [Pseudomonadota bacterium]
MPVFEYKALNRKGKKIGGLITAEGPSAARLRLGQDLIFPTEIKEVEVTESRSLADIVAGRLPFFRRVDAVEVTTALRQLATLVSSGMPLLDCLNGLIEQTENGQLKKIFSRIREKVTEGSSLSRALSEHPSIFSDIHVNLVRAGETGGALDTVLKRLADFSEKKMKMKKKIESALAYPIFLLLISSVILIFLMSFVMPKVIGIFRGMELALPWSTRTLIWMTSFISRFWWVIGAAAIGALLFFNAWVRTDRGRSIWDALRIRMPFLGKVHHKAVMARFASTLSLLMRSGITLVGSLEIAKHAAGNRLIEQAIGETTRYVGEGSDFATPLKKTGYFPPLLIQLIRAGEKSGDVEEMLAKAAEVYEDDVESSISSLTSMVEPVIILLMGVMVGFMVMAILLPIFDMTTGIK